LVTGALKKDRILDYNIAQYLDQSKMAPGMELREAFLLAVNRGKAVSRRG